MRRIILHAQYFGPGHKKVERQRQDGIFVCCSSSWWLKNMGEKFTRGIGGDKTRLVEEFVDVMPLNF